MSMQEWAKKEVELACKKENPSWDGKTFDYGCTCYLSALKAYESLCEDGHSGFSFNLTKNILNRLMYGRPLTPITESDFTGVKPSSLDKKTIQCPRMSSLFRSIDKYGNFQYEDLDRVRCIDINNESILYVCKKAFDLVNERYPITLPYMPVDGEYKIYTENFSADKNIKGDDTTGYLYMITPNYERIELNMFEAEINGEIVSITKEQYEERKKNRIK